MLYSLGTGCFHSKYLATSGKFLKCLLQNLIKKWLVGTILIILFLKEPFNQRSLWLEYSPLW